MKKLTSTLILVFCISSCAGLPGKKYIIIQEPDQIYEFGKFKYSVEEGDILKITETKTCRGGIGTCFEVRNIITGEYGYVRKSRMEKRHYIYTVLKETGAGIKAPQEGKLPEIDTAGKIPRSAKLYANLGNAYLKQEQYTEAIDNFTKAIESNKDFVMSYINRGIAYEKQGQNDKACSDWKHACELGECNMLNIAMKKGACK